MFDLRLGRKISFRKNKQKNQHSAAKELALQQQHDEREEATKQRAKWLHKRMLGGESKHCFE